MSKATSNAPKAVPKRKRKIADLSPKKGAAQASAAASAAAVPAVPPPLRLEYLSAADLADNPANWRTHPQPQLKALQDVLAEVGWAGALLFNEKSGRLIDGHARKKVVPAGERVPVLIGNWTEEQEAKILATLDPLAAMATANKDALGKLLAGVQTESTAIKAMLADLAKGAGLPGAPPAEDPGPQIDKADELRKKWKTARGQLWVIGRHRLLCGDSTDAGDVARVMGGERAAAVVTDPPYGVGVDYGAFKDTEKNVRELIGKFMPIILAWGVPIALTPGVPAMWSYPKPAWLMAWVHPAPNGGCPWGFAGVNPILVYGDDPYLQAGLGRRPDSIVAASDREGVDGHPTPKPLKVWKWLVERLTPEAGQLLYDPFLGSGTTLVAAEQTARRCFGIEIDPRYVGVCLERLASMGLTPELEGGK